MINTIKVSMWGLPVGIIHFDTGAPCASFQYFDEFIERGLELSPLMMPLSHTVYRFPELSPKNGYQDTYKGLPGLIADSLPEKFGNRILGALLARKGLDQERLTPLDRLCYLGTRGMGALEFEPSDALHETDSNIDIHELVEVAREVLNTQNNKVANINDTSLEQLISIGTSAGGAKAKAVIAWNEQTGEVRSGNAEIPEGFSHWLMKFDNIENEEHAVSTELGKIEYAYYLMALDAGINMMESKLFPDGGLAHFVTRRFDRDDNGGKIHVQSYCALAHADRNPPGRFGYEHLYLTARRIGCAPKDIRQLYIRTIFNAMSRNQDDHTKNHAFLMGADGNWSVSPAYDLCFSYKPGNRFIEQHQMSINGKRDGFTLEDYVAVGKAADIRRPEAIINNVKEVVRNWPKYAELVELSEERTYAIAKTLRCSL